MKDMWQRFRETGVAHQIAQVALRIHDAIEGRSERSPTKPPVGVDGVAGGAHVPRQGTPTVYVASAFGVYAEAHRLAVALTDARFEVASRWHGLAKNGEKETSDAALKRSRMVMNLADLARSDVMVFWTATGTPRAGYVEVGYALARGIPILWVQDGSGAGSCLADGHPLVTVIRSADTVQVVRAVAAMVALRDGAQMAVPS